MKAINVEFWEIHYSVGRQGQFWVNEKIIVRLNGNMELALDLVAKWVKNMGPELEHKILTIKPTHYLAALDEKYLDQ